MIRKPDDTVRTVMEKGRKTAMEKSVTLEMIRDAREALKGVAEVTPVVTSKRLGTNLFIKSENLQKTGSFKIRGAYNKIRHLTPEEKESLDATEEFDEDWEKVVFRMCQKETYLSNRAFQVSQLLSKIAEIVNNEIHLGEIVESTIALSAVTNLKAFDGPLVMKKTRALEVNTFNGKEIKGKGRLCHAIVKNYVEQHPDVTLAELKSVFNVPKCDCIVESLEVAMTITDSSGKAGGVHYVKENDWIMTKEGAVVVWSYWPERYYAPFMEKVQKLGIKIG